MGVRLLLYKSFRWLASIAEPPAWTAQIDGGQFVNEITVFATAGPQVYALKTFDSEGNEIGVLPNGSRIFDITVDPPICNVGDEGHGTFLIDPGPPAGAGDCVVTFNFASPAGGPTRPGTPFTIHVLPGDIATATIGDPIV